MGTITTAQPYPAIPNSGFPSEMARGTFFSNSGIVYVYAVVNETPTLYDVTNGQYVHDKSTVNNVAEVLKVSGNPQIQKNTVQADVDYLKTTQTNVNILKYIRPIRDLALSIGTDVLFTIISPWGTDKITIGSSTLDTAKEIFKTEMGVKAFILREANKNLDMLIAQGNRNIASYNTMLTYHKQILPLNLYYEVYLNQKVRRFCIRRLLILFLIYTLTMMMFLKESEITSN